MDLFKVADVIRERGWCQGQMFNRAGNVCIIGAINVAWDTDLISAWTVMERLNRYTNGITRWNDAPGRTVDEVLALIEAVAMQPAS